MENTQFQQDANQTPYPNIPPIIESREDEYVGSGITSTVAIAGHPIHPVIVTFPIVFLTSAAATDLAYWFTKDFFWARASVWLIGLGVVSGILAALIGMLDFLRIPRVGKRTAGWTHMLLNVSALILSGINFGLRFNNPESIIVPIGAIISIVVASLLGLGGWYGGELTFRHKVGVIGTGESS